MQAVITRRLALTLVAPVLVAIFGVGIRAQALDVTGDWTFAVETGMGSGTPAVTFKQAGEAITGTYAGTIGSANFTGTLKGAAIEFAFEVEAQGQTIDVRYKGVVDKDTMKGDVVMAGGQLNGTFTGKRK